MTDFYIYNNDHCYLGTVWARDREAATLLAGTVYGPSVLVLSYRLTYNRVLVAT